MVKKVSAPHITEIFEGRETELLAEPEETIHYSIASVKPEDAENISRLIYRTFRYTYPKEELYYPKRCAGLLGTAKSSGL